MAGSATIKLFTSIEDMTGVPQPYPGTISYTITGIDEVSSRYSDIAAAAKLAIDVGEIDTVTGFWIYVVTGGSDASNCISVDLETATYTTAHDLIYQGEARFYRPLDGTELSVENSDSSTATIAYMIFGDNA